MKQVQVTAKLLACALILTGCASMSGGAWVTLIDGETGFGITGASGTIAFDGQSASTERISGNIAQGGTVSIAGSVDIAAGQFPANLRIDIANGRYNDGAVVNALFDAALVVNGPLLGGATMSGTVALGRTEIQLPDRLSASSTAIDQSRSESKSPSRLACQSA